MGEVASGLGYNTQFYDSFCFCGDQCRVSAPGTSQGSRLAWLRARADCGAMSKAPSHSMHGVLPGRAAANGIGGLICSGLPGESCFCGVRLRNLGFGG